jgi:hypothetical protein
MYWEYQTILFEFRKDGLLGDKYIDDAEVENNLNEQGKLGWELVNVTPVQEGLLAFLKKEKRPVARQPKTEPVQQPVTEKADQPERPINRDYVQVQDRELVPGPGKKRQNSGVRGENDLIGGIKIS